MSNTLIFFLILCSILLFILMFLGSLCLLVHLFNWILTKYIKRTEKEITAIETRWKEEDAQNSKIKYMDTNATITRTFAGTIKIERMDDQKKFYPELHESLMSEFHKDVFSKKEYKMKAAELLRKHLRTN